MAINVKNTTENSIIDIVCPHFCRGCGAIGSLLCERCKNYVLSESSMEKYEKCNNLMVCGERKGLLEKMVREYKYGPVRGMSKVMAKLLSEMIPELDNAVIVPLPTISKHIRERGFDHILLIAKRLARIRGWECRKVLYRKNSTVQVGADAKKRFEQAQSAYGLSGKIDPNKKYLLVDDVWTTGASMGAAEKILKQEGAEIVYKAVVAKGV